jgi:hypothetical protein
MTAPLRPPDPQTCERPGLSDRGVQETTTGEAKDSTVPPAFRNRRAFLIWAFAIGAVPPERVVERVVAEIQREAQS